MGPPWVGFRVLLLALLAAAASGFSFQNTDSVDTDFAAADSGLSPLPLQQQQQQQQFASRIGQPQQQFNFQGFVQPNVQPNIQPLIVPFAQPSAPTLFQLGSNSHRRHHRHYHQRRKESGSMSPQTFQQQLSLLQAASMFQNTQRAGTLCQQKALQDRSRCGMQLTCFMTQCQVDGSFAALQCNPTSRHCWCVDNQGEEIDRTRVSSQNSGSAILEIQCNNFRRQSLQQSFLENQPEAPPIQHTAVQEDDIRTLSLQEIQAIISEQARKVAEKQLQPQAGKHLPVLSDVQYQKPAVLTDTEDQPKITLVQNDRGPVKTCASACRSKCFVTMDVSGCLGNCDTECGQQ